MMLQSRQYLCVLCMLACAPVSAEIYKCTDPRGAVHYTDKPCAGDSSVFTPSDAPKADADSVQRREKTRRLLRAFSEEQEEEEQAAARLQHEQQQRELRCANARNRLDGFLRANRVYRVDENGEQVNLNADERAKSTDEARAEVELWCD